MTLLVAQLAWYSHPVMSSTRGRDCADDALLLRGERRLCKHVGTSAIDSNADAVAVVARR